MNKRYRVIFNESTQTYSAVAEDVPAKGKKASTATKALVATAVGLGATTITYASWVSTINGGASVPDQAIPKPNNPAPGLNTAATSGANGIALGTSNKQDEFALAGGKSIAIGVQANADYEGTGNAFSIGHFSSATANSIVFGNDSKATGANAIALGHNSSATANNIALGNNTVAVNIATDASRNKVTLLGTDYNFAAANRVNSLNIGTVGAERLITNVAAGNVTATSTHAINGSQLYAAYDAIDNLADKTWSLQTNGDTATAVAADDVVSFNDGQNIKITRDANDPNKLTVATADVVRFKTVNIDDSIKLGDINLTKNYFDMAGNKITNVAEGDVSNKSKDVINGSQLYQLSQQTWQLQVNGDTATAVGDQSIVSFNDGKNINVTRDGNKITIATKDDVLFNSVGVGSVIINSNGINAGNKKITNVADGAVVKNSKDAVNGGQLYDAIGGLNQTINNLDTTWNLLGEANGQPTTTKIGKDVGLQIKGDGATTKVTQSTDDKGNAVLEVSTASPLQYVDDKGNPTTDQFTATDTVALVGKDGKDGKSEPVTLTNVDKGALTTTSTDAINGSQLYSAGTSIGDIIGGSAEFKDGNIIWNETRPANPGDNYVGGIGDTGEYTIHDAIKKLNSKSDSVSEGWFYTVEGEQAGQVAAKSTFDFASKETKIGDKTFNNVTVSNKEDGLGIEIGLADDVGVKNLTASESLTVGDTIITSKEGNLQIGQGTITSGRENSIGLGKDYTIEADNSIALGNGSVAKTPVGTTGVTIRNEEYKFAGTAPVGTVSVGSEGQERTITNVAAGQLSADSTDAVNGSQLYATNQAIENINNGAIGVVQYANPETPTTPNGGTKTNTATLVGKDTNAPVSLTNVAAGKNDTDAVNVSQLNQVKNDITNVKNDLNDVDKRASAGSASAMAAGLLPQAYDAGSSMLGVSAAHFDGEQGYAVGYSSVSEGGKWVVRAAGTGNSQEKYGVAVSAGYRWS